MDIASYSYGRNHHIDEKTKYHMHMYPRTHATTPATTTKLIRQKNTTQVAMARNKVHVNIKNTNLYIASTSVIFVHF